MSEAMHYAFAPPSTFTDAWDESYGYDANLDYLTSFSTTDGQANASQTWSYDAAANRVSDYTGSSWAYDNLNRMTANGVGTSCSNDVLGNRTALGSTNTYSWDALNRMTGFANSSVTEAYAYRADGMRVAKSNSSASTKYRYDGQMGIEDVDTTGSAVTTTEYALGARGIDYLAATTTSGTSVAFPIYDVHGNMVSTLARSGSSYSLASQRDFDPWGNIRGGASTGDPKGRYCAGLGHKQDDESGLIYMRARYYETGSGRFLSRDANGELNGYSYARNSPTNRLDRSGNDSIGEIISGIIALICLMTAAVYFGISINLKNTADMFKLLYSEALDEMQFFGNGGAFGNESIAEEAEFMSKLYKGFERGFNAASQDALTTAKGVTVGGLAGALGALVAYNYLLKGMLLDIDLAGGDIDPLSDVFG